jgi:hypothetical protein
VTALGCHLIDPQNLSPEDWFHTVCRKLAAAEGAESFAAQQNIMRKGRFVTAI